MIAIELKADIQEAVREMKQLKDDIDAQKLAQLKSQLAHVKNVAASWFPKGTRGFHPRPGGTLRTEGLRESPIRKKKQKFFVTLWHPLATLYANFKTRRRIKWLNIIYRLSKRSERL